MPVTAHRRRSAAVLGAGLAVLAVLSSALVSVADPARADVTTISVDSLRTGWDRDEPTLSPSDVGAQDFGQLFATQLDGAVYAQPVLVKQTLLVVTEKDLAYGLDPVSGAIRWKRDVGPEWSVDGLGCGDLVPTIGITATPAVDPATGTAYFTAKVDSPTRPDHPHWELHGIDVATGSERAGFPTTISGSPDNDPTNTFAPRTAMQRPGLLLMDGVVYAAFASHCDKQPYVGYVIGFDASTGRRTAMWASETGSSTAGAGIWHSGGGLVSDGPGRIILATGNGVSPAKGPGSPTPKNLAESVVRLQVQPDRTLEAVDFFSPVNNTNLDTDDTDLGSGAPMAVPDGYGTAAHPHLLVESGKDGRVFLLDRDHLGGSGQGTGGTDDVLQTNGPYRGVWGHPAFWGGGSGYVYLVSSGGPLSAFKLGVSGSGDPTLTRTGASVGSFGYTSGSPVVTSAGTTAGSGLVWVVYSTGSNGAGGQLRAYDATPDSGTLNLRYSVPIGTASKFATPATDHGRVYVANRSGQVLGFGRPTSIPLVGTPTDFGLQAVGSSATQQVTLTARKALTVTRVTTSAPFAVGALILPRTLAAGARLTVPVTFEPGSAGSTSGALSFTTSVGTYAFDVHGFATADGLRSDPASLDFGQVPVGGNVTLSISVSNTGATTTSVTRAKAPAAPFRSSSLPAVGTTLATGASVSVPVTFAPTSAGSTTSEVVVSSSSGDVRVPVTGVGVTGRAELTIAPEKIDFGNLAVGNTTTKVFQITNTGNLLLTLTKAAPPTAPFLVPTPVSEGQQIEPGETIRQAVMFGPTKAGPFDGGYIITGNDGHGPHVVELAGSSGPRPPTGPVTHASGKCLDVRGSRTTDGTRAQLFQCNRTGAQGWTLEADGTLRALGKCLDTRAGGTTRGTKVEMRTCDGAATQVWAPRPGTASAIASTASGLCLEVPGNRPVDQAHLQLWTCAWSEAQHWTMPG